MLPAASTPLHRPADQCRLGVQTRVKWDPTLEQKKSMEAPGYEAVTDRNSEGGPSNRGGGDDDGGSYPDGRPPPAGSLGTYSSGPFAPKRRTVSGSVFQLPVQSQLPT